MAINEGYEGCAFFIKKCYNFYREKLEMRRRELISDLVTSGLTENLLKKNLNKRMKSEYGGGGDDDEYYYKI
jgi:hypothetical protein